MALVLRTVVGRPLTWQEGDDNLTYLEQLVPAPGGASGELQYNDNGTFSGVANLVYTNNTLQATGSFKGDLDGTAASASYVLNAESASYALTALTASFVTGSDVNGAVSEALHATLADTALTASYIQGVNVDGAVFEAIHTTLADTASYVGLSGLGITVNNLELTASVRSVNGILPVNGNIQTSLSATKTGTSASFDSSGSGAVTGSIPDGLVWIISGDPTPAWNGDTYIYNSGSVGAWYPIASLDIATTDTLYLRLDAANDPMVGDINMGGRDITNIGDIAVNSTATINDLIVGGGGNTGQFYSNNVVGARLYELPNGGGTIALGVTSSLGITLADINGNIPVETVPTASFVTGSKVFGPYGANSVVSSSFAASASYALTASYLAGAVAPAINVTGSSYYANQTYQISTTGVVAIGNGAGASTLQGSEYSVYLGVNAGGQAETSSYSNFLGTNAGQYAKNAIFSNFIGYTAGYAQTTASYSTYIGYQAGRTVSFLAPGLGSNNIIIGSNITLPAGATNSINIGGLIFATGSYSNMGGNPSSGSAGGRVGINVTSPTSTLDVSGSFNVRGTATLTSASAVGDVVTNLGDTYTSIAAVTKVVSLTAAEYAGITTPDANTLYIVI